jgi:hypothetical protein
MNNFFCSRHNPIIYKKFNQFFIASFFLLLLSSCLKGNIKVEGIKKLPVEISISIAQDEVIESCHFRSTNHLATFSGTSFRIVFSREINPNSFLSTDIINIGSGGGTTLNWSLINCGDNKNFKLTTISLSGNGTIIPKILANKVLDLEKNGNYASIFKDNNLDFNAANTAWKQEAYIKAANADINDQFGIALSLSGDTLAVASYRESSSQSTITNGNGASSDNSSLYSGAVYVYKRDGVSWSQEAYIKAVNSESYDCFGNAISLSGDTLAVGAVSESSNLTTITNGSVIADNNLGGSNGAVYVYKRTGANWIQEAYIKAANSNVLDQFGNTVSLSGDTLIVGSVSESSNQTTITNGAGASSDGSLRDSGAVYIYKRSAGSWSQEAYIKASNANRDDYFSNSVSINGDTLAVGAIAEDSNQTTIINGSNASTDNSLSYSGAVYIYKRQGITWTQEAYVKAVNAKGGESFGNSVSVSGDTLSVGAPYERSSQTNITNGEAASSDESSASSGAVYIYKRLGIIWKQEAYIKAANSDAIDYFGEFLSLSTDTLAVGAKYESSNQTIITNGENASSDNSLTDSGAVYVYKRSGGSWSQEAYIKAVNANDGDHFGQSLSINGDSLVVGAPFENSNQISITNGASASADVSKAASGAVYVYRNTDRLFNPPELLSSSQSTSSITLNWGSGGALATGYRLAYLLGPNAPEDCEYGNVIDTLNVLSFTISGLKAGSNYSFRICSYDNKKNMTQGYTSTFQTLALVPEISNLTGGADSYSALTLNWISGGGSTAGFKMAWLEGSTPPVDCRLGTIVDLGNVLTFQLQGLKPSTNYGIRICAYDSSSHLSFGQYTTLKTQTAPNPTNLFVTSETPGTAIIHWTSGGGITEGFKVAWVLGTTAPADCNQETNVYVGMVSSYTITGVTPGENISARVCAYDLALSDHLSSGITITGSIIESGWYQEAYIKAVNNGAGDNFGASLSLSGDTLAVGAFLEDSNLTTITNGESAGSDNSKADSGGVYVYKRSGKAWIQETFIKAGNSDLNDKFGENISLDGNTLAVGVKWEDSNVRAITNGVGVTENNLSADSGAVYVYKRTGANWIQEAYIKSLNSDFDDRFGASVSISGDTLAVGAVHESSNLLTITNSNTFFSSNNDRNASGAVYIYKRSGTTWVQEAYLKADNARTFDNFGRSLSLSGDTLAVFSFDDSAQTTITTSGNAGTTSNESGAVYIFKRTGSNWVQEAFIKASNNGADDIFGLMLSVNDDTLVVSAINEDNSRTDITNGNIAILDNNSASNSGAVYVYKRSGGVWTRDAYIKSANNRAGNLFGYSVNVSGNTLVVGAPNESSNQTVITNGTTASINTSNSYSGAVYIYKRSLMGWIQEAYVKAVNNNSLDYNGDGFGISLSLSGDTVAVGATGESSNQSIITNGTSASIDVTSSASGAVYVYRNLFRLFEVTNLKGIANSNSITLSWPNAGGSAIGYTYAYQSGATAPIDCLAGTSLNVGNVNSVVIAGLASSSTYSFRVCANQDSSTSSDGAILTVVTAP